MSSSPMLERLTALINRGERMRSFQFPEKEGVVYQLGASNRARLLDWKDSCLDLIRSAAGEESELYRAFPVDYPDQRQGNFHTAMEHYLTILRILLEMMGELLEYEHPKVDGPPTIVDGARRLLEADHKDAAAIYCRAALEISLRSLCRKSGVEFEAYDSINKLAQRLRDVHVLSTEEFNAIQTWSTFANAAAYQKFSQYGINQVEKMVGWLEEFIGRTD